MSGHYSHNFTQSTSYIPPPTYPFNNGFVHSDYNQVVDHGNSQFAPYLRSDYPDVETRAQPPNAVNSLTAPETSNGSNRDAYSEAEAGSQPINPIPQNNGNQADWLHPHKTGGGGNLYAFKDEIEERTKNGENCLEIAAALIAKGVQTSSKTISRKRIAWGFRKRCTRKANPNRPPPYKRVLKPGEPISKRQTRIHHKADIIQFTQQGLPAEEIARIMISRGMELHKGASGIRRLQSRWRIVGDARRELENFRYTARRKARTRQRAELEDYAKELGVEDQAGWVAQKLEEPAVKQRRQNLALELMGDRAPKPEERRARRTAHKDAARRKSGRTDGATRAQRPAGTGASDDEYSSGSSDGESDEDLPQQSRPVTRGRASGAFRSSNGNYNTAKHPGDPSDDDSHTFRPMLSDPPDAGDDANDDSDYPPMMDADDYSDDNDGDFGNDIINTDPIVTAESVQPPPAPEASDATPQLVVSAEEASTNSSIITSTDGYIAAAQTLKGMLEARMNNRPAKNSLTGLPPSASDVARAREQVKAAATAMMGML